MQTQTSQAASDGTGDGSSSTDAGTQGAGPEHQEKSSPPREGGGDKAASGQEVQSKTAIRHLQGNAQIASIIYNTYNRRERGLKATLARSAFKSYDRDAVETEARQVVYEDAAMDAIAAKLVRRRILVLVGEAGLGKRSMAVALARRLWLDEDLRSMILLPHPPDRDTQVNLHSLVTDLDPLDRFLILPDAFDGDNAELRRFFSGLTQDRVEEISAALEARRAFLVLTSSYDALGEQIVHKVKDLYLAQEVRPLPPELLDLGFRKRVEGWRLLFVESQPSLGMRIDEMLASAAVSGEIVRVLRTMPRITEFVDEWLVLVANGEVTLHQALRRVASLEDWLLFNAQRAPEEWSYVLALVLCHTTRSAAPCSWLQFDLVRRELDRFLRRELRIASKPGEKSALATLGADEALCRSARAEVREAGSPGVCTIHFREEGYAEDIWQILFGPGRRILSLLHVFCERQILSAQSRVAEVAARALGRIGEIDPHGVVVRWMGELLGLADEEQRAARLGAMFQGILGSQNSSYREECLWYFRVQLLGGSPVDAATAIGSLRWIGEMDLEHADLALESLQRVAREKLIAPFKNLNRVEAQLREIEPRLQSMREQPDNFERTAEEAGLMAALELLFPGDLLSLLFAVEWTLMCLGFAHGQGWLLAAFRGWMKSPEPLLRPLTALLFLHWKGIADILEAAKVPWPGERAASSAGSVNWLLVEILSADKGEEGESLAAVLEEMSATFSSAPFPSLIKQELRPRLRRILKSWAKQGLARPESRAATLRFFKRLLQGGSKLATDLSAWIRSSPDLAKDPDLLLLRPLAPAGE